MTPPDSPQAYENVDTNMSDAASLGSEFHPINPPIDDVAAINALQSEVDFVRDEISSLRVDFIGLMDVVHEELDHLFQIVYSFRRHNG